MSTTAIQRERADIRAILAGRPADAIRGLERWRKWLLPLALAGAALVIAYLVTGRPSGSINYVTTAASRGNLVVLVTATGTIQPTRTVAVSSELSGTVRKVLVDYNSIVSANEPLAELDTDKLDAATDGSKARLDAAQARLVEAEAAALEAKRDLNRKRVLAGKKVDCA